MTEKIALARKKNRRRRWYPPVGFDAAVEEEKREMWACGNGEREKGNGEREHVRDCGKEDYQFIFIFRLSFL